MRARPSRPGDRPWSPRARKEWVRRAQARSRSKRSAANIRIRSRRPIFTLRFRLRRVRSDRIDDDDIANLQVFAGDLNQRSIVETGAHSYWHQLAVTKQPKLCAPAGCLR